MIELIMIGLCVLAILLIAVLVWMIRALLDARTRLKFQDDLSEAKQRELNAQREALKSEFGELAAKLLGDKQRELIKDNAQSVDTLFRDLKGKLEKYEKEVENAAGENSKLGQQMTDQLKHLQDFADMAQRFTAALIGGNKIQGNQGEAILVGILAKSGFERGTHYDMQQGGQDEGRPDASIYDAMNKRIILIDAKMNIKDYIDAYNLPDDEAHRAEKTKAVKRHVESIKRQIDNLSAKNYAEKVAPTRAGYTNLPLVAMFCPFNAVLEAALNEDPELMQYAYKRNVVLVTPLTLWGYLWLISWGWKQQAVENKYEEIKKLGGDVLSALDAVLDDLKATEDALGKAKEAFSSLRNRMTVEKGKASVTRVAKKLMDYGIVTAKQPKQLDKMVMSLDTEQPDVDEQPI